MLCYQVGCRFRVCLLLAHCFCFVTVCDSSYIWRFDRTPAKKESLMYSFIRVESKTPLVLGIVDIVTVYPGLSAYSGKFF